MVASNSNDIIRLNVGGQHFITTRTTLLCKSKDLYLRKCFVLILILHNRSRSVEKSFWDRKSDSIWFAFLIYLRDAGHVMVDLQSNDKNNDNEDDDLIIVSVDDNKAVIETKTTKKKKKKKTKKTVSSGESSVECFK